jgi:predicted metal-binding protein
MRTTDALRKLFHKHGFTDFRWLDPQDIVVAQWVRMKCQFGCPDYGRAGACPPHTPSVQECERFFREYKRAAVFHFEKKLDRPEDRHAWTRKLNLELLKLERDVFLAGFPKAFLLFLDTCNVCLECSGSRSACKEPRLGRPVPEGLAVDVFSTVRKLGYPIQVLPDYKQIMNRYAFLLIE